MIILHCTQKLLTELGTPLLTDIPADPEGLGNWYVNLIRIDRRKCLLFTNEKTLYSFLIPAVKKENLKNIVEEFLINLSYNLQAEGFSPGVINRVMQKYKEVGFAKTSTRQVLGAMNEFAFEYDFLIKQEGGLERVRILEINRKVNRTPLSPIEYQYPIEVLNNLLQEP